MIGEHSPLHPRWNPVRPEDWLFFPQEILDKIFEYCALSVKMWYVCEECHDHYSYPGSMSIFTTLERSHWIRGFETGWHDRDVPHMICRPCIDKNPNIITQRKQQAYDAFYY